MVANRHPFKDDSRDNRKYIHLNFKLYHVIEFSCITEIFLYSYYLLLISSITSLTVISILFSHSFSHNRSRTLIHVLNFSLLRAASLPSSIVLVPFGWFSVMALSSDPILVTTMINMVPIKLSSSNYLMWRHQVILIAECFDLMGSSMALPSPTVTSEVDV